MEKINLNGISPHKNIDVLIKGNVSDPKRALVLIHGRFASAANIISLSDEVMPGEDVLILAPEAHQQQWYPHRFIESRTTNQPNLDSALNAIKELVRHCEEIYDIGAGNITLAGFSQGACLVADYIALNPKRYGGVCIFSGGLIGNEEDLETHNHEGDLAGTPIYIGCDQSDLHIPVDRVRATTLTLKKLDANVTERIYEGLGHSIHREGAEFLRGLIK